MTGVDNRPMKNYPFEFVQADALEFVRAHGNEYDFIHASPPCQFATRARTIHGREHPDLLTPMREALVSLGIPWVVENVPGAPMRADLILCGSMFGLETENGGLIRHRWFEFGQPFGALVAPCSHPRKVISVFGHGGHVYHGVEDWRRVMGINWMSRDELAQAIPPAYCEFVGHHLMLRSEAAA